MAALHRAQGRCRLNSWRPSDGGGQEGIVQQIIGAEFAVQEETMFLHVTGRFSNSGHSWCQALPWLHYPDYNLSEHGAFVSNLYQTIVNAPRQHGVQMLPCSAVANLSRHAATWT